MSSAAPETEPRTGARRPVDLLFVSLGTTLGLRIADDRLLAILRAAGLEVELARPQPPREVRTLMLTDLAQARAAASATRAALARVKPRRILYSTTTAALLWPEPGAIRFDALAQATRPGHHGLWQRPLERRRLLEAPLLLPADPESLAGASAEVRARRSIVVPIPLADGLAGGESPARPSGAPDPAVSSRVDELLREASSEGRHPAAVTYAADPYKKGLDRLLLAWARARRRGELLLVTGRSELPDGLGPLRGVRLLGRLEPAEFRALVRAVGVLAMAPRREDYGMVQLEALAEGARVATCAAPGPYAALPLIRGLWPDQVVEDGDDAVALGLAIRHAIDAPPHAEQLLRATAAVDPWRAAAVREQVEREVIPALFAAG